MLTALLSLCLVYLSTQVQSAFIDFEKIGAIPFNRSLEAAIFNGDLLNKTFNSLSPRDIFFVPNRTYSVMGGIKATGWKGVEIRIDGTLLFSDARDSWPRNSNGDVEECIMLYDIEDVIFTSSGKGGLIVFISLFSLTIMIQVLLMVMERSGGARLTIFASEKTVQKSFILKAQRM